VLLCFRQKRKQIYQNTAKRTVPLVFPIQLEAGCTEILTIKKEKEQGKSLFY